MLDTRRYFLILAILSAILLLAPLRTGDLTGYDDAQYAHIAKDILRTGDWLVLHSNGEPALENPPLIEWMEASLFAAFGFSDALARLPSALCGLGVILLVYWLARKLTGDSQTAVLAMFVMATSLYFLKYTARGMTDVPFTFFVLCAVCAWSLTADDPRWYLAAGACTALAQMTRSMMGLALPAVFVLHLIVEPPPAAAGAMRFQRWWWPICRWRPGMSTWFTCSAHGSWRCTPPGCGTKSTEDCPPRGAGIPARSSMRGCWRSPTGRGCRRCSPAWLWSSAGGTADCGC